MLEWETIAGLITLVGFIASMIIYALKINHSIDTKFEKTNQALIEGLSPLSGLEKTITKLNTTVDIFNQQNEKEHKEIKDDLDKSKEKVDDHEIRIVKIEEKIK